MHMARAMSHAVSHRDRSNDDPGRGDGPRLVEEARGRRGVEPEGERRGPGRGRRSEGLEGPEASEASEVEEVLEVKAEEEDRDMGTPS